MKFATKNKPGLLKRGLLSAAALLIAGNAQASSHREAPFITEKPKVDGTDFYMFNSYEAGRQDFVTLIANYLPLQDAYGGPNYFTLDPQAVYEIHIDNNGDAREDITFQFKFNNDYKRISLEIGPEENFRVNQIPLAAAGPIGPRRGDIQLLNVQERFSVNLLRGIRRKGSSQPIRNASTGGRTFMKPVDNIGTRTISDYNAYARRHIYNIEIPGCTNGRMFVGQRKESFVVNLGQTFDLLNIANPVGARDAEKNTIANKNITSLILEVPKSCLVGANGSVIAGWTSASLPKTTSLRPIPTVEEPELVLTPNARDLVQVSRLANPLVNEVLIGLGDKDRFNATEPQNDPRFFDYFTHPTFPRIVELVFGDDGIVPLGVQAPRAFPRGDLVAVFLTGVPGLNQTARPAEMMRLNTSIAAKPASAQNSLGVLGGDLAGYPNGRRPGDDVVDISLRAAMGVLLPAAQAPSGQLPYTDGAIVSAADFDQSFPYLKTPLAGNVNP